MFNIQRHAIITVLFIAMVAWMAGCSDSQSSPPDSSKQTAGQEQSPASTGQGTGATPNAGELTPPAKIAGESADAGQSLAKPADIAVLVNKTYKLPDNYKPQDLVEPNVPFTFKEKSEKRLMRKEAAGALEKLFKAAQDAGVPLAGVSAYRSSETQKSLFNRYVQQDGEAAANKYSAKPGYSEHETGLAIDVSGTSGKCAAQDCFADTKEAKWLADHASEFGFIIRYQKGKETITGYQYEPWHLRYVGTEVAKEIVKQDITLEEYTAKQTIPVSKNK